jgi:hypothetical protein
MLNSTIQLKIKQRLNKLDSKDYDNIEVWKILEAFNKGMLMWCRRNIVGTNQRQIGDEGSKRRIDDLQVIIKTEPSVTTVNKEGYVEIDVPIDYFEWKSVTAAGSKECCDTNHMKVYLVPVADIEWILDDHNKKPSYEWSETVCTIKENKIQVYHNDEFEIPTVKLTYYKFPRRIEIAGAVDPYTGIISTADVLCEFKDDIVELFIDEAVKILSGDIESLNQMQIAEGSVEGNN